MSELLSICIPTFNRCKYLTNLLDQLACASILTNDIKIYISDNESTDDTKKVVDTFIALWVGYLRH